MDANNMDVNNISNNIISLPMNSKELMHKTANNIVADCIDTCIDNCIKITTERQINGFYLLKYNNKTKKYTSNLIEYSSIIKSFHEKECFLVDILNISTKRYNDILPIPVLNGKYLKENICINNLEHKLIIIFINMKYIDSSSTFSYFMNSLTPDFNVFNDMSNTSTNSGSLAQIQNILNANQINNNEIPIQNISLNYTTTNIPNIQPNAPGIQPNAPDIQANIPLINPSIDSLFNEHLETYNEQIEQMKAMGFTNEYKIIESLIVSDGDVNNAIHYYLQ